MLTAQCVGGLRHFRVQSLRGAAIAERARICHSHRRKPAARCEIASGTAFWHTNCLIFGACLTTTQSWNPSLPNLRSTGSPANRAAARGRRPRVGPRNRRRHRNRKLSQFWRNASTRRARSSRTRLAQAPTRERSGRRARLGRDLRRAPARRNHRIPHCPPTSSRRAFFASSPICGNSISCPARARPGTRGGSLIVPRRGRGPGRGAGR